MQKNLYFYSDAKEWGGQEILSAQIASILAEAKNNSDENLYKVHFFYANENFEIALSKNIFLFKLPFHSQGPFPIIRDFLWSKINGKIKRKSGVLKKIFQEVQNTNKNFTEIIICPGNIERCLPAIEAASKLKIKIKSYYPMAFTQKESRANFGFIRDKLAFFIYPKINSWVVNTEYQKKLLQRFIKKNVPVQILPNPLTFNKTAKVKIPEKIQNITTIGRIYFKQKGQEIIPFILKQAKSENIFLKFHIIGNGPDLKNLNIQIKKYHLKNFVEKVPWANTDTIQNILTEKTDLLFIPSKFESGPIVLFEALECGIPVLIANEPYVQDYKLPSWMLYTPGSAEDALQKIQEMPQNFCLEEFEEIRKHLFIGRSRKEFKAQVLNLF